MINATIDVNDSSTRLAIASAIYDRLQAEGLPATQYASGACIIHDITRAMCGVHVFTDTLIVTYPEIHIEISLADHECMSLVCRLCHEFYEHQTLVGCAP